MTKALKPVIFLCFTVSLLLLLPLAANAGNGGLSTPEDCLVCHQPTVHGEHQTQNVDCLECHFNPTDPDIIATVNYALNNGGKAYCAYCHETEAREIHLHSGEHDHAQVPPDCTACHGSDIRAAHIDRDEDDLTVKLSCSTCHSSTDQSGTDPTVRTVVDLGLSGTEVICSDCHLGGSADHSAAHDHAVISDLSCLECHADNVVTEHVTNNDLTCTSCHDSAEPAVLDAIATGSGPEGVDVDCSACHGATNHLADHNHAVIYSPDCLSCHADNVVTEHITNHDLTCAVCHNSTEPVVLDAIATGSGPAGTDIDCYACHGDVDHSTAHNQIFLMTRQDGLPVTMTSSDDPADGVYDNLPPFRPSETCGACHRQVADNHWGNFHSGLRMLELLDAQGDPIPRGTWDPSRPWISGPGMFGNWCPTYQRQLADMNTVFTDENEFLAKVDLSAFEFVQQCSICHVGGGIGDLNPYGYTVPEPHYEHDNSARAAALATDATNGNHDLVPLNAWDFQVKEGMVVQAQWHEESGILDVDCLMCHLAGYKHLARNAQITDGTFKNAATVGTGVATPDPETPDVFDYQSYYVSRDPENKLYLNSNFSRNIKRIPDSANCLACHMPESLEFENEVLNGDAWQDGFLAATAVASSDPQNPDPLISANQHAAVYRNDYLKRGDSWHGDEVHKVLQCGGCHSETGKFTAVNQHSPGKGLDPLKFPAEHDETVKTCEDCHLYYGDLDGDHIADIEHYGPPEMQGKHHIAGLLAPIVPTARRIVDASGTEEEFLGNHLDIISCTACHVQKRYTAARSVDYSTGGRFYNLTGNPPDLPPAGEEIALAYTWRENTRNKVIAGVPNPEWRRKIYPFNYLTAIYWDNIGTTDANGDGFSNGSDNNGSTVTGDPFFLRTIKDQFLYQEVNDYNDPISSGLDGMVNFDELQEWAMTTQAGSVMFTQAAEIDAFQTKMTAVDSGYLPRLSLKSQPFLLTHNVMPTTPRGISGGDVYALGTPVRDPEGIIVQYGCTDCHNGSNGIFNGAYDLLGSGRQTSDGSEEPITITWNDAGDVRADALWWDRQGTAALIDFSSGNQTRTPTRSEFLGYDPAKVTYLNTITAASQGIGVDPIADILSIDGKTADGTIIDVVVGSTVTMIAADAGVGGPFSYGWTVNDASEQLAGQTVEKTFGKTGLWTVMLTVVDEEGKVVQNSQKVSVVPPGAETGITATVTPGSPSVILSLSNMPTHDSLYFYYGDGLREQVYSSDSNYSHTHNYRLRDKYLLAGNYTYQTSVRIYLAGALVETIQTTVVIPAN
ncbi:MAG: hypothetical protein JXO49_05355 [Deltaproteobacteria bacterium]|nr:hypothetical protein [Candidatus Anaeroferrophillus wilburensis]MBN2888751.1 hypothetical protein [Deltaproteobacteria bacterium]